MTVSDLDEVIELIESSKKLRTEFSFLLVPMKSARAEIERLRLRGDGHAETLRGIANMDPATEGDRMRQWARDGLSGYTGSTESTIKSLMDEIGHAHKCIANTRDALWTYDERPEYARKILDDYWREHAMEQYLPDATPTPDPRDAEIERLEDALQEIASQGRPIEYDAEQQAMADYEAAYDMCVLTARAAIKKSGTTKECEHTWSSPAIDAPPAFCTKCRTPKVRTVDVPESETDSTLPCCGSDSGVHLIGCQSESAHRIHRAESEKDKS